MRFKSKLSLILLLIALLACWGALASLAETAEAPDAVAAPMVAPTPSPAATPKSYRELLNGSKDGDGDSNVYMLQVRLIELGYLTAAADGQFGDSTEAAVLDFQLNNGLVDTGIADMDTQQLLYSDKSMLVVKPTPTPTPRAVGASGSDVKLAQTMMGVWGFLDGYADGEYGKGTEDAVQFLKEYMYDREQAYIATHPTPTPVPTPSPVPSPTPYVGPDDQPIVIDMAADPTPIVTPEPTPYVADGDIDDDLMEVFRSGDFDVFAQTAQEGDKGDDVKRVQTRLGCLGYLYKGADGAFGANTARALKFFQLQNNLNQSGVADEETQRALFSQNAVRSTEYVYPYKLIVDVSDQRVYVYQWTGASYSSCIYTFICSTGAKSTPTPLGTYQAAGSAGGEWYYFKEYNSYAKWGYRIVGGILFHSVLYNQKRDSSLVRSSVSALGHRASHGCVRLKVEDAKWINQNCPAGTTVVIQN